MDETIELQDSLKPEEELDDSLIVPEAGEGDLSTEEKNAKLSQANTKLFARAKKAETELKALKQVPVKEVEKPLPPEPISESEKLIDKKVNEKLEERELQSLDISDELKKDLKTYAKVAGLSIQQVLKSDFFSFKKQKEDSAKKAEEASIGGKRGAPSRQDFDVVKPPKVDMSTKEGQETWENYKTWLKNQ